MERTTLRADGWIQIPAGLRHRLGLKAGDAIEWTERDGALVGVPVPVGLVDELFGAWRRRGEHGSRAGLERLRAEERSLELSADTPRECL